MKLSAAALLFLFLAAALADELQVSQDTAVHNAADCCFSLSTQRIRCRNMKDYSETSGCSLDAVIFLNKKGKKICTDPREEKVLNCMKDLKLRKERSRKQT
ncbi:PREDICTED: C-C motif chemokine 15-like [Condylura cristata]|uniref:C-C motif chemokine 15-like n=1 Tax=Condylura cristata TaxID=143302 RepID=UPI000643A448|nr:PREDICTED: C-C motif chemokine 15-like [Condylura cristata]